MATSLAPPPLDNALAGESKAAGPWQRWLKQLWETVRGASDLEASLGTVANTKGTQTFENKTISGDSNTLTNIPQSAITGGVYGRITSTSGQAMTGASTLIQWSSPAVVDSHSAFSGLGTAAFRYTAPQAGIYLVASCVLLAANGVAGVAYTELYKNNARDCMLAYREAAAAGDLQNMVSAVLISLATSDYIDIRLGHTSGGSRNLSAGTQDNHLSIFKVPA